MINKINNKHQTDYLCGITAVKWLANGISHLNIQLHFLRIKNTKYTVYTLCTEKLFCFIKLIMFQIYEVKYFAGRLQKLWNKIVKFLDLKGIYMCRLVHT